MSLRDIILMQWLPEIPLWIMLVAMTGVCGVFALCLFELGRLISDCCEDKSGKA